MFFWAIKVRTGGTQSILLKKLKLLKFGVPWPKWLGECKVTIFVPQEKYGKIQKGGKFVSEFRPLFGRVSNLLVFSAKVPFLAFQLQQTICSWLFWLPWLSVVSYFVMKRKSYSAPCNQVNY